MTTELLSLFPGSGEVARDLRTVDWAATPLGSPSTWPRTLGTALRIMLMSRFSMWMAWGDDLTYFCNDAYRRDTLGVKYPWALGRSIREVWGEIWDDIGPRIDSVLGEGVATWDEALLLFLERSGYREETYHTFSYSPLVDDADVRSGVLCVVAEETERVLGERRLATLRELSGRLASAGTQMQVYEALGDVFGQHDRDLPFVRVFEATPDGDGVAVPVSPDGAHDDPALERALLAAVSATRAGDLVHDLPPATTTPVPRGGWPDAATTVSVLPLVGNPRSPTSAEPATAWLVAGLNPYRPAAETVAFARLVARQVSASLGTVRAFEAERRRAADLEELDRAKTQFFSNVSHEFRTPLTLMLGPLDELRRNDVIRQAPQIAHELEVVHRNGVRLSKLVNSLLEFSRIQAGRATAQFEPVDVVALTEELVGSFRTVVEQAGLELRVSCTPVTEPVYVDPNMWERIVLNLMSNAVKYTFEGSVNVQLGASDGQLALSVRDTGIGIAGDDVPRVFERFHRVEHARARSAEGTGIGLALVAELVALHGGAIDVESTPGRGSTFTVTLPLGRAHLPPERIAAATSTPSFTVLDAFVDETRGWIDAHPSPDGEDGHGSVPAHDAATPEVLIVDDNADMRAYVQRVLEEKFRTRTARDGGEALSEIERARPDLVVSDIMMPVVDGIELVRRLRADEQLADLPVMLLTAQAGSTAELQGINVGADDYLVKPFSSDELLARVRARLLASAERTRRHRLARLVERLQRSEAPHDVLGEVHAVLAEWFGVEHTTLALLTDDGAHLQVLHDPPFPHGISERYHHVALDAAIPLCEAVREATTVFVADRDDAARRFASALDDYDRSGTAATLAVPVRRSSGAADGSLTASFARPPSLHDDDIEWFERVAGVVADVLDRIRVARRDQETLRAFQEQLLTIDQRAPVAVIAARYQPAASNLLVGGDWYDVSTRRDGALRLSIGDVVGKGLPAAQVMAQLRSAVGTAGSWLDAPSEVLHVVDGYAEQLTGALCATVTVMALERDGTLAWCSAGHPPPLVAQGDGVAFLEDGLRPPLAADPDWDSSASGEAALGECALLFLYTDGLVERRGEDLRAGAARLREAVQRVQHLPLDALCDAVLDAMRPDDGYRDDVALLAVRTRGERPDRFVDAHPATPEAVRDARRRVRGWLERHVADPTVVADVLLAVGEAVSNACEHGSGFDPDAVVGVELTVHEGVLRAAVTDHGDWTGDSSASARDGRGRGFAIMDQTTDRVDVRRSPIGTTVLLERRC